MRNETALKWTNEIFKERAESINQDLANYLVSHITQANGSKIPKMIDSHL